MVNSLHHFFNRVWKPPYSSYSVHFDIEQCRKHSSFWGWLYTFCISHFAKISQMFLQNTPQNTKHSLYSFGISCEFCVLLMPRKNKLWNPLTFRANADPGTKCCKMWKAKKGGAKCEKSDAKYLAIHFSFFAIVFAYFAIVFAYFAIRV